MKATASDVVVVNSRPPLVVTVDCLPDKVIEGVAFQFGHDCTLPSGRAVTGSGLVGFTPAGFNPRLRPMN